MAPLKLFSLAITASVAVAFSPSTSRVQTVPSSTQLYEDFGLGLGEQTYENQPDLLKGEQEYKQYVNRINEDNMLNKKVRYSLRIKILFLISVGFFIFVVVCANLPNLICCCCYFRLPSLTSTMLLGEFVSLVFLG